MVDIRLRIAQIPHKLERILCTVISVRYLDSLVAIFNRKLLQFFNYFLTTSTGGSGEIDLNFAK